MRLFLTLDGRRHRVHVSLEGQRFTATVDGETFVGTVDRERNALRIGGRTRAFRVTAGGVAIDGQERRVEWEPDLEAGAEVLLTAQGRHEVRAPMPGRAVSVLVSVGDAVKEGQPLLVLEAMKMQSEVPAPVAGTITAIHARPGDAVTPTDVLLVIS